MLAKLVEELPIGDGFLYEPKWDGFRAIVFRGGSDVFIQSRDSRPLDRYFPELHDVLLDALPDGCILDGEIVIATPRGLDFDALQMRLHPAASRVAKLAKETPSAFVAFDLLAVDGRDVRAEPQRQRRVLLERLLAGVKPPIYVTPMTRDSAVAAEWLSQFEGAGLDGVIAKPEHGIYEPGKRAMFKIKHARTADCVVAGFRWHKTGKNTLVGSLLLGLYDDKRQAAACRRHLVVHDGEAQATGSGARASAQPRAGEPPVARLGGGGRDEPHARRPEPLERGKRSVVGAVADRARLRGQVRPHAGGSFPSRRGLSAMAARQTAERLPLRPARGHDALRAREGFWRVPPRPLTVPQSSG